MSQWILSPRPDGNHKFQILNEHQPTKFKCTKCGMVVENNGFPVGRLALRLPDWWYKKAYTTMFLPPYEGKRNYQSVSCEDYTMVTALE